MTEIKLKGRSEEEKTVNLVKNPALASLYLDMVEDIIKRNSEDKNDK
jgi:hypothetical protein